MATQDHLAADALLDVPAVADTFNIPERAARELFNRRVFPLVQLGRRLYVRKSEVDAYFETVTIPAKR